MTDIHWTLKDEEKAAGEEQHGCRFYEERCHAQDEEGTQECAICGERVGRYGE